MDALQIMKAEIAEYLRISKHPHLADCLDMVPEKSLDAIYNMIADHQSHRLQKNVTALYVSEDVAAIVEGKPENAEFSKPFLNAEG